MEELKKALQVVRMCLSNSPVIPAYSWILFNKETVETCNGIQGIRYRVNTGIEGAVVGYLFAELANRFEDFSIEVIPGAFKVKSAESVAELPLLPKENFISAFESEDYKYSLTLNKELIAGINLMMNSINKSSLQEDQNGLTLHIFPNNIVMYATNNIRASKFTLDIESTFTLDVLLPEQFCRKVVSVGEDIEGTLYFGEKTVMASFADFDIVSKIRNVELLPFEEKIFSKIDFAGVTYYPTGDLSRSVFKALALADERNKYGIFHVKDNLYYKLPSIGSSYFEDTIKIQSNEELKFKAELPILYFLLREVTEFGFSRANERLVIVGKAPNFKTVMGTFTDDEV